jgi:hypothetical protein
MYIKNDFFKSRDKLNVIENRIPVKEISARPKLL